jgi:hypothetical protein
MPLIATYLYLYEKHQVQLTKNQIAVFKLLTSGKTALAVCVIVKQSKRFFDRISIYKASCKYIQPDW